MINGKSMVILLFCCVLLFGCGASTQPGVRGPETTSVQGKVNAFNPWMNNTLPNTRGLSSEGESMLGALGASSLSIEGEAAHRPNWKDEIYPIVFGQKQAPNEIIMLFDFANPQSEKDWQAITAASKSLSPQNCKIVIFGHNGEPYGTDLTGLAIWLSRERPGQAMPYLTYALKRWNEVKAAHKSTGQTKKFINEYDATITAQDFPIHYGYLSRLNPPVPASAELAVAKYCYDAGNVNMYQANQVAQYYGVRSLPAVIVNGQVLANVTAQSILSHLR